MSDFASLKGKVALVTGSATGIGAACVAQCRHRGGDRRRAREVAGAAAADRGQKAQAERHARAGAGVSR